MKSKKWPNSFYSHSIQAYFNSCFRFILGLNVAFTLLGCDPDHKEKCEWYFEPDFDQVESVEPGWVALCAMNRVVNKQRCLLKARLEYAKALQGKAFRLSTMKIDEDGPFPKEVLSVKVCKAVSAP